MAIEVVAKEAVFVLTPFLSGLLIKAGDEAAKKFGEKFPEGIGNLVKRLWYRLEPKLDKHSMEIAESLANHPEDEDAQVAFRYQLKKLLSSDKALAAELQELLTEIKAHPESTSYSQHATGNYIAQAQDKSTATVSVNKPDDV